MQRLNASQNVSSTPTVEAALRRRFAFISKIQSVNARRSLELKMDKEGGGGNGRGGGGGGGVEGRTLD